MKYWSDTKRKARRLFQDTRGDVLMEYVLINLLVVLALAGVGSGLVNPSGSTFTVDGTVSGDNYGLFGNALVESWQRVMSGIALPVP